MKLQNCWGPPGAHLRNRNWGGGGGGRLPNLAQIGGQPPAYLGLGGENSISKNIPISS